MEIGLFPLGLVLLPGEFLPLHIFEERYKELLAHCIASGDPFGVLYSDDAGVRSIGTKAIISEVIESLPDGRSNILVEGGERFQTVALTQGRSFHTAEVKDLKDGFPDADPQLAAGCLASLERIAAAAGTRLERLPAPGDGLSFRIAAQVDVGPEAKQELLELTSENARLERLTQLLDGAVDEVRKRTIGARASGNGKVDRLS